MGHTAVSSNRRQRALSPESICLARNLACNPDGLAKNEQQDGDPLVASLVQSTTFTRSGVGTNPQHQYSRVSNPTVAALETVLGNLEDAPAGVCFGTGLAAETALFFSLLKQGDHVVCGASVYGGTTRLLQQLLSDLGVTTTFVDSTDLLQVKDAITPATKLVFVETPANPTLGITDIQGCADIAHEAGALLAVDNTFQTAVLQRPLDLGADITVYSTTKFIDGHSVALGGALITRNEEIAERFRFIRKCTGAIQSPLNAWLTINGIKTLPLRIKAQSKSATKIAQWLCDHDAVESVYHPSLATGESKRIAERQHLGDRESAHGAVVSFEIKGGYERGCCFVEQLKLCTLVEHVGSVETLITHPASMTHADVPADQRKQTGISDGLLRLSVGIEDVDEIIDDLEQSLSFGDSLKWANETSNREIKAREKLVGAASSHEEVSRG
jgi:cystathionine beta-lyase/cystathionine gamma-synthase